VKQRRWYINQEGNGTEDVNRLLQAALNTTAGGFYLVNFENVTLCKLALASTMYDSLMPFNYSLGRLNKATGGSIDLTNPTHRISLLQWLNDWGCRHLSEDQHDVASNSILNWYQVKILCDAT